MASWWLRVAATGPGAKVSLLATEIVELLGDAAVGPLEAPPRRRAGGLAGHIERSGVRGAGKQRLAERHWPRAARLRSDVLRYGLAQLAAADRDALAGGEGDLGAALASLGAGDRWAQASDADDDHFI